MAFLLPPESFCRTFCSKYIPTNTNGTTANVTKAKSHLKYNAVPMAIPNVDNELSTVPMG